MRKNLGIITIVLIILTVAACDDGLASDGDEEGTFTVTDIPVEYNGKYAMFRAVSSSKPTVWGIRALGPGSFLLTQINDGKVIIPLLLEDFPYAGNDTYITSDEYNFIELAIFESSAVMGPNETALMRINFDEVRFSKGSAVRSYNDHTQGD